MAQSLLVNELELKSTPDILWKGYVFAIWLFGRHLWENINDIRLIKLKLNDRVILYNILLQDNFLLLIGGCFAKLVAQVDTLAIQVTFIVYFNLQTWTTNYNFLFFNYTQLICIGIYLQFFILVRIMMWTVVIVVVRAHCQSFDIFLPSNILFPGAIHDEIGRFFFVNILFYSVDNILF